MAPRTSVIWDDVFTAYDFGPGQPMGPVRLDLTGPACLVAQDGGNAHDAHRAQNST